MRCLSSEGWKARSKPASDFDRGQPRQGERRPDSPVLTHRKLLDEKLIEGLDAIDFALLHVAAVTDVPGRGAATATAACKLPRSWWIAVIIRPGKDQSSVLAWPHPGGTMSGRSPGSRSWQIPTDQMDADLRSERDGYPQS
jgi:hypothetical protein